MQSFYEGAVAVIVPSLCSEIATLVIPEAFMNRTPVIGRKLAGMREGIEQSGGGLLFETEEELMGGMNRLLEDPSYRDALGELGYQAYLREWTQEVHFKRYSSLIEEIGKAEPRRH